MRVFGLDFDCDDRHQILEVGAVPHAFSALAEPRKVDPEASPGGPARGNAGPDFPIRSCRCFRISCSSSLTCRQWIPPSTRFEVRATHHRATDIFVARDSQRLIAIYRVRHTLCNCGQRIFSLSNGIFGNHSYTTAMSQTISLGASASRPATTDSVAN